MKLSNELKKSKYQLNCKNQSVVENYIQTFQQYTKDTVENILKLGSLVLEMKNKRDKGDLDDSDMNYFCFSVGLNEKSSNFRKFKRIGECAGQFRKYLDKLPDSYTVLYEITTLDPDLFEVLMNNDEIHSYVTLRDVKKLAGKVPPRNNFLSSSISVGRMRSFIKLINKFTINVSRDIPKKELDTILDFLQNLQNKKFINFEVPQITECVDEEEINDL